MGRLVPAPVAGGGARRRRSGASQARIPAARDGTSHSLYLEGEPQMPKALVNGVNLYYEEAGSGTPVLFLHEFAGDYRAWEPQMRYFSRRYRCITFSNRGYPGSDVPDSPEQYSQDLHNADAVGLLDHLKIRQAHLVGCSMGSFTTLYVGLQHPERCLSLTISATGSGVGANRAEWLKEAQKRADNFLKQDTAAFSEQLGMGPTRIQLYNKDRRGWEEFVRQLKEHSAKASAYTLQGVQAKRPHLFDLADPMRKCQVPALVVMGDEDITGLEGALFIKNTLPRCGYAMFPKCGHACNLEDPGLFNSTVERFLAAVEAGAWPARDPRSLAKGM
jgi:pimeloyl-ACP methyl ester carboxylesterase